jgi:hypothetical protein
MTFKNLSALLILVLCVADSHAGPPQRYRRSNAFEPTVTLLPSPTENSIRSTQSVAHSDSVRSNPETSRTNQDAVRGDDALAEVNATRAQRGLRPYQPDPLLHQAAVACAKQRAARLISGHLPESDFSYLPSGASAAAAGCAAWTSDWGWGSCCTFDNYSYAGASWVMGQDGRRYMHLFVR